MPLDGQARDLVPFELYRVCGGGLEAQVNERLDAS